MTIQQDLPTPPTALHPFSEAQWQPLQQLLKTFNDQQAIWLSGYLAAGRFPAQSATPSVSASKILIAYGTETGNSKALAEQLAQKLSEQQLSARTVSLVELKPRALSKSDYLLLICSTHGDGDPPEPAVPFFDALLSDQAPRLESVNYAVLALGDSSYERYCTAGSLLDERLAQLGANRLLPCRECDVDFQQPAEEWQQQILELLPKPASGDLTAPAHQPAEADTAKSYSKQHPFSAELLENTCLSHQQRELPFHHLELLLDVNGFALAPGDAVGVMPQNSPALVAAVLNASGLSGEEAVLVNGIAVPLVQALREQLDLTIPSQNFLDYWAELSASKNLQQVAGAEAKERRAFLKQQQLLDLLQQHPGSADAQALVNSLRPLQPRLYDVANTLDADTDELHLLVQAYQYPGENKMIRGVASEYLLQLQPGEHVRIYPHHNKRFHLPEQTDVPLILIGWGTGIAPFRAFAQCVAQGERTHPCWLVFGEQAFEDDFLYQIDWQQLAAKGVVQQLDTVFIEDMPDAQLSTPLVAQLPELADWLARGAHIYLCGDKTLLSECEATLQPLYDQLMAAPAWQQLERDKRIHRNLY